MVFCNVSDIWFLFVLNRLTGWQVQQGGVRTATHRMVYAANGNLTYMDGTGTLEYAHPEKPYAVTGVYAATTETPIPGFEHEMAYTSFYRPASITSDSLYAEFTYNAAGDRVKMESLWAAGDITARYYLGGVYEADTRTNRELLYIGGDAWNLYYIIRDYLGSICVLTNSGGVVAEYSYDPWGNLRDPETLETYTPGEEPELFLGRGFTGHEHLTAYGLINMNARLYDPMTGRFLSPDPYVQAPDFSQAFNRFSYCWNNPLRYVDEDGEWIHILIGAIIGGIANLVSNWKQADNFWEGLGYFAAGAAVGAGSAALGGWTAGAVKAAGIITGGAIGGVIGAASGAATNVALNGLNNVIGGQNFWNNWKQSAITGAISGAISGAIGGARKGFQLAKEGGKNMWWGNEVKYGRTQWSFFTSEKPYAVVKWDIENVGSLNENDCVPTSFAEANEYFGGDKSYEEYLSSTGYTKDGVKTNYSQ